MSGEPNLRDRMTSEDARPRLLAASPIAERRLDLAKVSTAVLEGGEGPPVILLHGPGTYGLTWLPIVPELLKSYRVIAPDLPGQGASVLADGRLDAKRVLDWLAELVAQTCQEPAVLVGHLTGGAIAARFASDHGHLVSRLVLVTPLGLAPFEPSAEFAAALTGYLGEPTEATHDQLWRECVSDLDDLRERLGERWESMKQYNLNRARTPAVAQAQRILLEQFGVPAIPPETLARITIPTTLIWGRHDAIVQLSVAEAASSRYGWPLHVIEAGNEPAVEAPDAFLRAAFGLMDA